MSCITFSWPASRALRCTRSPSISSSNIFRSSAIAGLCLANPHRRTSPPRPQAALWSLPNFSNVLQLGTSISIAFGIGISALPIFTGKSKERNESRYLQPNDDEDGDNVKWGVMSALALFPFLNPMAWVFGALADEDSSLLYWALAFVYTLPYIRSGLDLDGYAIAMLILGAVHMQIERVAQTEPAEVEFPEVLQTVLRSVPRALTALWRYGAGVGGEVADRIQESKEAQLRKPDRKMLEEKGREARMELDDFDRRRRQRQRQK